MRGRWDGNWDGSRSEEEHPARERRGCLWSLCSQQQLVHPTKTPSPAKQGLKGTAPAPGHHALFHFQEPGKLRHPCPPAHAVQRHRPSCVARAGKHGSGDAGLGRGQMMEASPGTQTRRPCWAGMCSGTQQSGLSWDRKKGVPGVSQGNYSLSLSPSCGKVPRLFSAPTS